MKSVMSSQYDFARVPKAEIPRSTFNRSHGYKTTFDADYLVPVYFDEALPGDTHILNINAFARLATPTRPIMDNMNMEFYFFAVPYRLLWDNFEKFMGAQDDPGDSIAYLLPQIEVKADSVGSITDYLGLPLDQTNDVNVCSLWHRAYNLIWNEWFRSQDLQDSVVVDTDDGPDTYTDYVLLKANKRHDYFTSCLPSPQKGDSVELPIGSEAPITGIMKQNQNYTHTNPTGYETDGTSSTSYATAMACSTGSADYTWYFEEDPNNTGYPNIRADLSNAAGSTVNELRNSFQIQRLLERDQRSGTRYTEKIRSHFGIISPDSRMQRPELLGSGRINVNVNPIAQTSESGTTKQGNLAGIGTASGSGIGFTQSFTEHCVLLGLAVVRADLTYQQGVDRMFSRETQYDLYWPVFSHLGEQAVLNKEIFWTDTTGTTNDNVFGYQERYAEYRYKPSKITGLFRSDVASNIDEWHLSEDFASVPTLNSDFIESSVPLDRAIAVPTEPHFIYDSYVDLKSVRPMPVYSVPGMLDHL
jgi:hypothetical protein